MEETIFTANFDASKLLEQIGLQGLCVAAVNQMVEEGIEKHIQFIHPEDEIKFGLKEGGRIPKVTIEWVDASDALTKLEVDELANSVAPLQSTG
jgi:hypothetical protein